VGHDVAIRVLHTVGSMDPGGVETWLINVLKYIDRDLIEFHFCTFGPKQGLLAGEVERLGGRMLACPQKPNLWSFHHRFRKILHEGKYDVVHSHVTLFSGVVLRWAKTEGVPTRIAHSHISQDDKSDTRARRRYRRMMKSWIQRFATHGVAVSKPAATNLFGQNWEHDARFRIVPCGIDTRPYEEPVTRGEIRAELGISPKALVVGHVGRFDPQKNHHFLLEIAQAVLTRRPDINFLMIGDGPLRTEIETRVSQMGLSNKIHFTGIRTDVPRLMLGAMDLFTFPSLYEGLGICLLEAQAAGLRCLVSDTVPEEVVRVPGSVSFISLSAGKDHWATRVIRELDSGSQSIRPLDELTRTRLSMQQSLGPLTEIYLSVRKPNARGVLEGNA
jgi:glycosyltransferase involved in cell wall biosynthesis